MVEMAGEEGRCSLCDREAPTTKAVVLIEWANAGEQETLMSVCDDCKKEWAVKTQ